MAWELDNAVFDVQSGVQIFTVQSTATYYIYAYGAKGGMTDDDNSDVGGRGAYVTGSIGLTKGDEVRIVAGQEGDGTGQQ